MIGAMTGNIVGSIYEFNNHRSKEFALFQNTCFFTDDTVMTVAVMQALLYGARGGDSDTLAAITGGIAEAFYGVPPQIKEKTLSYLPEDLRTITEAFYCAVAE